MVDSEVIKGRIINLKDNKVGLYYRDIPNQSYVYFNESKDFELKYYKYTNKVLDYNLTKGHSLVLLALHNQIDTSKSSF